MPLTQKMVKKMSSDQKKKLKFELEKKQKSQRRRGFENCVRKVMFQRART